jgi:uncharacterized membrane protein
MNYIPIGLLFFAAFWLLVAVLFAMIQIGMLQYAFESMGIHRRHLFGLLVLCLLGSYVNIPVAQLPSGRMRENRIVRFFGVPYVVPTLVNRPATVIAVNVGGAILPSLLSAYLIFKNRLFIESLMAVAIVAVAVHQMARPVPGVGIAVPIFVPPLVTAMTALIISRRHAAPLAYIAGSLGTLVGADLMNLPNIGGLGAPLASIGGAGKFDSIFLTGIVAVLLAGMAGAGDQTSED